MIIKQTKKSSQNRIRRTILIVMDGVGCGALPDAADYGDVGADSLGHVSLAYGKLKLPNLSRWGISKLTAMPSLDPISDGNIVASYGRCRELSQGKDTTSGHWEMAGVVVDKAFRTFPHGFSKEGLDRWVKENNLPGYLGNCTASGTEIIKQLGEESMRTGKPIVYTSADSVWQVAAHEDSFGLEKLYTICKNARKICDELQISRVIARPFIGKNKENFQRTHHRKDYAQPPTQKTMMEHVLDAGLPVTGIGKIWNIYNGKGIAQSKETKDNKQGLETLLRTLDEQKEGLIFLNLIDFDMNYGHRRDVPGYAKALMEFDEFIPTIEKKINADDLVIVTSDHGNDPTFRGTDHTREHVPLLVYQPGHIPQALGDRTSFSDIGQTILHAMVGKNQLLPAGKSFWLALNQAPFSAVPFIAEKRNAGTHQKESIEKFIEGLVTAKIPTYQASAWLMATFWRGLNLDETVALTQAMITSGRFLTEQNKSKRRSRVDKHSTGGLGDKVSMILAPLAASLGLTVRMVAGRGLGHTGGTIDKLESIPGFSAQLPLIQFEEQIQNLGVGIMGQTADFVPADKILYGLRDVTATVDCIPLITASILSKKAAEGIGSLVLDLKQGEGAFMKTSKDAKNLAKTMKAVAKKLGLELRIVVSDMNQPLGFACGNAIEMIECLDVLENKPSSFTGRTADDLIDLTLTLTAHMLLAAKKAKSFKDAYSKAQKSLIDGSALNVFMKMIIEQGATTHSVNSLRNALTPSQKAVTIKAPKNLKKSAFFSGIQTEELGRVLIELKAGRTKADDALDLSTGIAVHKKLGEKVYGGDTLFTVFAPERFSQQEITFIQEKLLSLVQFSATFGSPHKKNIKLVKEVFI